MNYHTYYTGLGKARTRTFQVHIIGHLLPNDDEIVRAQKLNIRAKNVQEAYTLSIFIRDTRLSRLWKTTTVTDLQKQAIQTWINSPKLTESPEQDSKAYSVVIIREAGTEPLTGQWTDFAEDHLTIWAESEQEAHQIASFISALPFTGQVRRTIINDSEYFDERN